MRPKARSLQVCVSACLMQKWLKKKMERTCWIGRPWFETLPRWIHVSSMSPTISRFFSAPIEKDPLAAFNSDKSGSHLIRAPPSLLLQSGWTNQLRRLHWLHPNYPEWTAHASPTLSWWTVWLPLTSNFSVIGVSWKTPNMTKMLRLCSRLYMTMPYAKHVLVMRSRKENVNLVSWYDCMIRM